MVACCTIDRACGSVEHGGGLARGLASRQRAPAPPRRSRSRRTTRWMRRARGRRARGRPSTRWSSSTACARRTAAARCVLKLESGAQFAAGALPSSREKVARRDARHAGGPSSVRHRLGGGCGDVWGVRREDGSRQAQLPSASLLREAAVAEIGRTSCAFDRGAGRAAVLPNAADERAARPDERWSTSPPPTRSRARSGLSARTHSHRRQRARTPTTSRRSSAQPRSDAHLRSAAAAGRVDELRSLIAVRGDVNATSGTGATACFLAAARSTPRSRRCSSTAPTRRSPSRRAPPPCTRRPPPATRRACRCSSTRAAKSTGRCASAAARATPRSLVCCCRQVRTLRRPPAQRRSRLRWHPARSIACASASTRTPTSSASATRGCRRSRWRRALATPPAHGSCSRRAPR